MKFLFFFQSNKSKSIIWKKNEQTLTRLELSYYKLINKIVLKTLKTSIFKNFTPMICGVILLIKSNTKQIKNILNELAILVGTYNKNKYKTNWMKYRWKAFSLKRATQAGAGTIFAKKSCGEGDR